MGGLYYVFFYIIFRYQILGADTNKETFVGKTLLSITGDGYLYAPSPNCTDFLDAFADSAANFTKCSIKYARPIKLCENCINQYVSFHEKYKDFMNGIDNDGMACKSIFMSQDRLDAILHYHDNILNIWNEGHCSNCYDWSKETPVISNETTHFNILYNETITCINNTYVPNLNNSQEVCDKCKQSYLELDSYYKTLSADAIGVDSVCMDIVDSMNATRSIWSKSLNCCKIRKTPEIIFLCCTAIISLLPVLYYLVLRYCGPMRDLPNVLKQSRFKQIIQRSNTRRIN